MSSRMHAKEVMIAPLPERRQNHYHLLLTSTRFFLLFACVWCLIMLYTF